MQTSFIGVQVRFKDSKALAAAGLSIPEHFLLQVPQTAIPAAGDMVVLEDHRYSDGSPVTVKVAYRAFGVSTASRKYMPYLYVELVPTLLLDGA